MPPLTGYARGRVQAYLRDRCTIQRPPAPGSGSYDLTTVATDVPCHLRELGQRDLAALPGGFEAVRVRAFDFAWGQDVRAEDELTATSGRRYQVLGTNADIGDAALLTAYAEARGA